MHDELDPLLKFEIPEIIFGRGSLKQIGQCSRRLGGERIMLVTDPGIIATGWIDEALGYLKQEGLTSVVYDNVVTNPRNFQVEQGAVEYAQKECDVIIAIGGGSPMDTAKGIAILASNRGRIEDYVGCNLITESIPPLICVPTTAGTGSDVSQFAIIADQQKKIKMTILSRAIMPDISLIDARLLQTESTELIASTGMDALTHAIEAYVSSLSWPLTDPHANHAIKLVFRHLSEAVYRKTLDPLEGMAIASLEAGAAFSNAILGAVHALAHPLGGLLRHAPRTGQRDSASRGAEKKSRAPAGKIRHDRQRHGDRYPGHDQRRGRLAGAGTYREIDQMLGYPHQAFPSRC